MSKKFMGTLFLSLAILAVVYFVGSYVLNKLDANAAHKFEGEDLGAGNKIEQRVANELLFLLVGVDENDVGTNQKYSRTDTMMVVKVNFDTGRIDLISIPRDTQVMVKGELDKINHAHAYGGMKLAMQTVRDFLDIDLDYYVKVDYNAVVDVVNAIGGVYANVPVDILVPELDMDISAGEHILNGRDALMYLRYREGYETGDMGRVEQQQLFMKELVKQVLKPQNILRIPALISAYQDNVTTNIPISLISSLAMKAGNIDPEMMTVYTIPGIDTMQNETYYYIPDMAATRDIVNEVLPAYLLFDGSDGQEDAIPEESSVLNSSYQEDLFLQEKADYSKDEYIEPDKSYQEEQWIPVSN